MAYPFDDDPSTTCVGEAVAVNLTNSAKTERAERERIDKIKRTPTALRCFKRQF